MLKNTRTLDNSTGLWSSVNKKTIIIKVYQKKRDASVQTGNNLIKILLKYKVFRIIKASYKLQGLILSLKLIPLCLIGFHLLQAGYKPSFIQTFQLTFDQVTSLHTQNFIQHIPVFLL